MAHGDRPCGPSGRRMAADDAAPIGKAFQRPPTGRRGDRNGGFPWLSDGVARGFRCAASPRRTLQAENLGKPSPYATITAPRY